MTDVEVARCLTPMEAGVAVCEEDSNDIEHAKWLDI